MTEKEEYIQKLQEFYHTTSIDEILLIAYQKNHDDRIQKLQQYAIDFQEEHYKKWAIDIVLEKEEKKWKDFIKTHILNEKEQQDFLNKSCAKNHFAAIDYMFKSFIFDDKKMMISLYHAASHNANDVIQLLWNKIQKKNTKDCDLFLRILIENENEEMLNYLQKRNISITNQNLLMYAIETENKNIFHTVYQLTKNKNDKQILQKIVEVGYKEIFEFVYDKKKHQDFQNVLLEIAVAKKYEDFIEFFIEEGADIHINNHSAIIMACKYNKEKLVKFLIKKGADFYGANNAAFYQLVQQKHKNLLDILIMDCNIKITEKMKKSLLKKNNHEFLSYIDILEKRKELENLPIKAVENNKIKI
jgi:ankyrin repeat protein